jgi:excisionase family DNA binding protein
MAAMVKLLKPEETAEQLGTTREVVYSPRWRSRVGLRAVRVGRSLRFREDDVRALIERGTEGSPSARTSSVSSERSSESGRRHD